LRLLPNLIPAHPPLRLYKPTDRHPHDLAHSPDLWHQSRLANVTYARSWGLCGITPVTADELHTRWRKSNSTLQATWQISSVMWLLRHPEYQLLLNEFS